MPSKKHQKLLASGSDKHHFYWPKKLYRNFNKIIEMSYAVHHAYHGFFMAKCKAWQHRPCRHEYCKYCNICCYHKTEIDYNHRVEVSRHDLLDTV